MNTKSHLIKNIFACTLIIFLVNCSSDSEEDPTVDCSGSDLAIALAGTPTAASCANLGSLTVSSTGGEGAVEYSIDGNTFQASATFSDLESGSYSITAKDNLGCTVVLATNITGNSSGTITFTTQEVDAGCNTSQGSITVNASGGNGTYQYSLNNGAFGNSNVFSNLSQGSYKVTVQDGDLCQDSENLTLTTGTKLSTDVMPIITQNCSVSGCHDGSQSPILSSAADIIANASRVKARTGAKTMPPGSRSISQTEIDMIACWVDDGGLNN